MYDVCYSNMKIVYIPLEISGRELQAKVLLAQYLAAEGALVVIGKKKQLFQYMEIAPPGVFLSIWGAHKNFKGLYKKLSSRGFEVAVIDEEGLLTISDDYYLENSLDIETVAYVSVYFCWGKKQKDLLQEFANSKGHTSTRFIDVGNMRFDLLRPEFEDLFDTEQQSIQAKYPRCILVISSFGFARHFDGEDVYLTNLTKTGAIRSNNLLDQLKGYALFQRKNAAAFMNLTRQMCQEFPEKQIVYRPHPSERLDDLHEMSIEFPNFFVDGEYSIVPWLRSVSLTIFNYCTTGPEAQVLGVPNVAYRPFKNEKIENEIPYKNSIVFEEIAPIISYIGRSQTSSESKQSIKTPEFDEEISGLGESWSVKIVTKELLKLFSDKQVTSRSGVFDTIRSWVRINISRENRYVLHKYGQVNTASINSILSRLRKSGVEGVSAAKIGKHLYKVTKKRE